MGNLNSRLIGLLFAVAVLAGILITLAGGGGQITIPGVGCSRAVFADQLAAGHQNKFAGLPGYWHGHRAAIEKIQDPPAAYSSLVDRRFFWVLGAGYGGSAFREFRIPDAGPCRWC